MQNEELLAEYTFITDKRGNAYQVEVTQFDNSWIFRVHNTRTVVGYAMCTVSPETLVIGDIQIYSDAKVPRGFWIGRVWIRLGRAPMIRNFQRRGLGTELLRLVIRHARDRGIRNVTGNLCEKDIRQNPNLRSWYKRWASM